MSLENDFHQTSCYESRNDLQCTAKSEGFAQVEVKERLHEFVW